MPVSGPDPRWGRTEQVPRPGSLDSLGSFGRPESLGSSGRRARSERRPSAPGVPDRRRRVRESSVLTTTGQPASTEAAAAPSPSSSASGIRKRCTHRGRPGPRRRRLTRGGRTEDSRTLFRRSGTPGAEGRRSERALRPELPRLSGRPELPRLSRLPGRARLLGPPRRGSGPETGIRARRGRCGMNAAVVSRGAAGVRRAESAFCMPPSVAEQPSDASSRADLWRSGTASAGLAHWGTPRHAGAAWSLSPSAAGVG